MHPSSSSQTGPGIGIGIEFAKVIFIKLQSINEKNGNKSFVIVYRIEMEIEKQTEKAKQIINQYTKKKKEREIKIETNCG